MSNTNMIRQYRSEASGERLVTLMKSARGVVSHAVFLLAMLGIVPICYGIPIKLVMTLDELLVGKAVLLGDLATLGAGATTVNAFEADGSVPEHWSASVIIQRFFFEDRLFSSIDSAEGMHISAPPPHTGEASPGPTLRPGRRGQSLFFDLSDVRTGPDPLVHGIKVPHDLPHHFDELIVTLLDLDPLTEGVTAGANLNVRMTMDFTHTPEPSTVILFATGMLSLIVLKRRQSR